MLLIHPVILPMSNPASRTHSIKGGVHLSAHCVASVATHLAKVVAHLILPIIPSASAMQVFIALMQSETFSGSSMVE